MPGYRKLGRATAHRKSMLRNIVTDLLREGRIQTTDTRAKEARREAEKLITLAKTDNLHNRRQALSYIYEETVVSKLFEEIAPMRRDRADTPASSSLDPVEEMLLRWFSWSSYRKSRIEYYNYCPKYGKNTIFGVLFLFV